MSRLEPERCLTCSDEAVEAFVVSTNGLEALVRVGEAEERVAIDLVPDVAPGDLLLCHAGIALERVEGTAAEAHVAQSHEVSSVAKPGAPWRTT